MQKLRACGAVAGGTPALPVADLSVLSLEIGEDRPGLCFRTSLALGHQKSLSYQDRYVTVWASKGVFSLSFRSPTYQGKVLAPTII